MSFRVLAAAALLSSLAILPAAFAPAALAQDSSTSTSTTQTSTAQTNSTNTTTATTSSGDGFFSGWFARVDKTQAAQPRWITPLATTTPRLEEEFRYDFLWQVNNEGGVTNNIGNAKGLELIPSEHVEIIINVPAYIIHNNPSENNGFGDWGFLIKYRLLSGNAEHGNYILTAFLGVTVPTGSYSNGAKDAVITPTIAYGKGVGIFDVQGTFGISFPTGDEQTIGHTYPWNNAFQLHLSKKFWPEVETNYAYFQDGEHDGKSQLFLTPGLVIGRLHLFDRIGLTVGGGYQIAATHFHNNNHNAIFSVRFPF